jgi:hypothetical protein
MMMLALIVKRHTGMGLEWISATLGMGAIPFPTIK